MKNFTVDVGGPVLAQLPILDFNGATRRNRPILRHGDVVYARVTLAHRDIDPIISCIDNNAKVRTVASSPLQLMTYSFRFQ